MSVMDGINGSSAVSYPNAGLDTGMTHLSPDALLQYCQLRLSDLDGQIKDQMTMQKTALREREAIQSAQAVLTQYGTDGPTDMPAMQKCLTAIDSAIAQLPDGDTKNKLVAFRKTLCDQYQVTPPLELTDYQKTQLATLQDRINKNTASREDLKAAQDLTTIKTGQLNRKPDANIKEWQGTTDALGRISDDVKSNAEIEMLQLQDLVSQRQQAVQLASGMMSKEDQALEAQAKAIGQ